MRLKCFGNIYLQTEIKSYNCKITSNFHGKVPKEGSKYICQSLTVIDSVFKLGKNYFPQAFLEECKYKIKKKEIKSFINDDLENFSDDDFEKEDFFKKF